VLHEIHEGEAVHHPVLCDIGGTEPVREFLRDLPKGARVKCGEYMQRLEWRGFALAASHLKKLSGSIWELRPEYDGIEYRLYFGVVDGEAVLSMRS